MRKVHFWFFFIVCLATGIGLGLVLRPSGHAVPRVINADTPTILPPIRGVHLSSMTNAQDLKRFAKMGINTVIIEFANSDLSVIVAEAKKYRLQVYFVPQINAVNSDEILALARQAASAKVDLLGIGYGLKDTGPDEEVWARLLADVRKIYAGPIAIVADMNNYPYVNWWDLADVVAVAGPFDLPAGRQVNHEQLRAAWNSHLLSLRSLVWRENKGLLMLNVTPTGKSVEINDAVLAAAEALRGQEWFVGLAIQPPPVEIEEALGAAWGK